MRMTPYYTHTHPPQHHPLPTSQSTNALCWHPRGSRLWANSCNPLGRHGEILAAGLGSRQELTQPREASLPGAINRMILNHLVYY